MELHREDYGEAPSNNLLAELAYSLLRVLILGLPSRIKNNDHCNSNLIQ